MTAGFGSGKNSTVICPSVKKLVIFFTTLFLFLLSSSFGVVKAQLVDIHISDPSGGDCHDPIGTWNVTEHKCTLSMPLSGVTIYIESDGIILDGNGNTLTGTGSGFGIFFDGKTGVTIKNLKVKNFASGITVYNSSNNNLPSNHNILDNSLSENQIGIYLSNSNSSTLKNNTVSNNSGWGIALASNANNNTVMGNTISNGLYGVYILDFSNNNLIINNTVSNNSGYGIYLTNHSNSNQIYNNNFIGNYIQAYDISSAVNVYNLAAPTGGNYWSNWTSPDSNNDGFVDPFNFSGGTDYLPHVCPIGSGSTPDTTPPVTTANLSGTLGNNGWYISNVVVTLNATDTGGTCGGGGTVSSTEYGFDGASWNTYTAPVTVSNEGSTTIYYRSTDSAGNVELAKTQPVKIDKTFPTITGVATTSPNANGWYKNDVTIHFTASDSVSGLDTLTSDVILSTEGTNQSVSGTATDKAGNSASVSVSGINIDKTSPKITLNTPTEGAAYLLNQSVFADWTATDSVSGIASASGTVASGQKIDTASVGKKTFNVIATDNAGNQNTQALSYNVGYSYGGVLWPIRENGSSVFGLGWIIPVRFRLKDSNGNNISNAVAKLYLAKVTNGKVGTEIEADSVLPRIFPGNTFIYDPRLREYDFFMATRQLSRGTWQLRIALDDGTSKYVNITLR